MSEAQRAVAAGLPAGAGRVTYGGLWELVRELLPGGTEELGGNLQTIAAQLEQIRPVAQQQAAALADNTEAVTANTVTLASGVTASAVGEKAKSAAATILKGFTLSPLISGLVGLFRGGGKEEPAALVRYNLPTPVRLQTGVIGGGAGAIAAVDYDEEGRPRPIGNAGRAGQAYFGVPITIQVQALDSRSFLEHSEEIARAVREALLNAHSLGEVISEL